MVTKEEYKQVRITFMQGFDHVRSFPYICLPIESIHLYIRYAVIFSYPKHTAYIPPLFKRGGGKPAEADFLSKIHQ